MASQVHRHVGDVNISGAAQVQFGDNYTVTHNHFRITPPQDIYAALVNSLSFDGMGARVRNVPVALSKTCQWLYHHQHFLSWRDVEKLNEHQGFLYIKGKPGSGKTTIMKETLAWAEQLWTGEVVLSYFFNARSPYLLEKSSLGLYRSLVHQILLLLPSSQSTFMQTFSLKFRNLGVEEWEEGELQNFCVQILQLSQLPPITVFIDALDEGADCEIRQMVSFLESWTEHAASMSRPLRLCLASRHYPHITVAKSLDLILEDQAAHRRDIELYIRRKLVTTPRLEMNGICERIQARSAGVFLWVVLVIPMLNRAYDQGRGLQGMLRRLQEVPPDMNRIFESMIFDDLEDLDECITLMEWVLFSMQPLSVTHLFQAICHVSRDSTESAGVDSSHVEQEKYLLNCSRGLIEITQDERHIVQFIHETVRSYLISNYTLGPPKLTRSLLDRPILDLRAEVCHIKIAEDYLRYLLAMCESLPTIERDFDGDDLACYAAGHWWRHIQVSKLTCPKELLDLALRLLVDDGVHLQIWQQLNGEMSRFAPWGASRLYCAASTGIPDLVRQVLTGDVDLEADHPSGGTALQTAVYHGHVEVVQMLLDLGANSNARGGYGGAALKTASGSGHERIIKLLIDAGANVNRGHPCQRSALEDATYGGHEKVVEILLDSGANVDDRDASFIRALDWAVSRHGKIAQLLFDRGAVISSHGAMCDAVLKAACRAGDEHMMHLALDAGADVNHGASDRHPKTALYNSAYRGFEHGVRTLINRGADVNLRGGRLGTALEAASMWGNIAMVQLLLEKGADVHGRIRTFGKALHLASKADSAEVVEVLLNAGADINVQDFKGRTALSLATLWGHKEVVEILRQHGARIA